MFFTDNSLLPSVMTRNHLPLHTNGRPLESSEVDGDHLIRSIVDTCLASVAVLDESGTVLYVSRAWGPVVETEGPAESKNLQSSYLGIGTLPSGKVNALHKDIQRIVNGQVRELHKEYSVLGDDGPAWFLIHAARLDLSGSNRYRILVTREDVTRRREAEAALRNLGGRLITAQEEERSRVARELHDGLNQQLALMSIELEQLARKVPTDLPNLSVHISHLQTRAQEIATEIHRLSYQLHPARLDHLGLAAAIKSLCDELSEHHEISIEFKQQGFPALLSKDVTLCVFRITQEALQNAISHSGARTAKVLLRRSTHGVRLQVSDKGCGFNPQSSAAKNGLGLISMRERLRLVGGSISIRSQPSRGTRIDVMVPG